MYVMLCYGVHSQQYDTFTEPPYMAIAHARTMASSSNHDASSSLLMTDREAQQLRASLGIQPAYRGAQSDRDVGAAVRAAAHLAPWATRLFANMGTTWLYYDATVASSSSSGSSSSSSSTPSHVGNGSAIVVKMPVMNNKVYNGHYTWYSMLHAVPSLSLYSRYTSSGLITPSFPAGDVLVRATQLLARHYDPEDYE